MLCSAPLHSSANIQNAHCTFPVFLMRNCYRWFERAETASFECNYSKLARCLSVLVTGVGVWGEVVNMVCRMERGCLEMVMGNHCVCVCVYVCVCACVCVCVCV